MLEQRGSIASFHCCSGTDQHICFLAAWLLSACCHTHMRNSPTCMRSVQPRDSFPRFARAPFLERGADAHADPFAVLRISAWRRSPARGKQALMTKGGLRLSLRLACPHNEPAGTAHSTSTNYYNLKIRITKTMVSAKIEVRP